eukprot:1158605-Pelagomonas_calceolata.AAC.18
MAISWHHYKRAIWMLRAAGSRLVYTTHPHLQLSGGPEHAAPHALYCDVKQLMHGALCGQAYASKIQGQAQAHAAGRRLGDLCACVCMCPVLYISAMWFRPCAGEKAKYMVYVALGNPDHMRRERVHFRKACIMHTYAHRHTHAHTLSLIHVHTTCTYLEAQHDRNWRW